MMKSRHSVALLVLMLVFVSGCKKKNRTPKAATQPPAIATSNSQEPAQKPTPAIEVPLPEKSPDSAGAKPAATKPRTKPSPRKPAPKPPEPKPAENTTVAKATPPRIVVQPGGGPADTPQGTVVPELTHTEETHRRLTTEQLMHSTETNLKSLRRVLNEQERAMLQQIQLFMTQSREASQTQDLVRAHNLALKAHLLSDELVR